MIEAKMERTTYEDDPQRCQATHTNGQCLYVRLEGSEYCQLHGGNKGNEKFVATNIRNYRLAKYQTRVGELAENPKVKSLREEIGILRMMLEEIINRCQDENDLLMYSNKISDMIMKIEKVVVSCHKLEESTGQLLDKSAAMNFAAQIVNIISVNITDVSIVDKISTQILASLADLQKLPGAPE